MLIRKSRVLEEKIAIPSEMMISERMTKIVIETGF
jgi:hypothetical protein